MAGKYWPRDAKGTARRSVAAHRSDLPCIGQRAKAKVISRSVSKTRAKLKINLGAVGKLGVMGSERDPDGAIVLRYNYPFFRSVLI